MQKVRPGSFGIDEKERVIQRISELARRHPSRSAAARVWGVNINTLNSYFKNLPETPMPRQNLLQRIAESEGVTLEWLLGGDVAERKIPTNSVCGDGLMELLAYLTDDERQQLTAMLARKGVEASIQLLLQFSTLTPSELDRVIRLTKQIREGASEENLEIDPAHPTHKQAS